MYNVQQNRMTHYNNICVLYFSFDLYAFYYGTNNFVKFRKTGNIIGFNAYHQNV